MHNHLTTGRAPLHHRESAAVRGDVLAVTCAGPLIRLIRVLPLTPDPK
jgi:hypothetical protein